MYRIFLYLRSFHPRKRNNYYSNYYLSSLNYYLSSLNYYLSSLNYYLNLSNYYPVLVVR